MANFKLDNYVPVHERLSKFYGDYPTGRVQTSIVEHDRVEGFVLVRAEIYRDSETMPSATGHAFEERGQGIVNKTSYVENAETSAVGRALALLGYEIKKGLASREEMEKVERMTADSLKVEKQNGHYIVDSRFKVTKPGGRVECDCGIVGCPHIEAVRAFATSAN